MIFMENKRSNLSDSAFGAKDRRFPLDTEQHIRSAIRLFGHAKESEKHSLAKNIKSAADKYGINMPETTQVYKYLNESYVNEDVKYEMIYNTIMNELRDNGQDPKIDKKDSESFKNIGRTNNSDFDYKVCICNLTGDYDVLCYKINKNIKPLGARLSPDNYGTAFINIDESNIEYNINYNDISWWYICNIENPSDIDEEQYYKSLKDAIKYYTKPEEFNNQSRVRKYVFTNGNSNNEDGVQSLVCLGQIWVYYYEDDDKYDYEWIVNYPIKKGDDGSLENVKEFSMASMNPIVGISKPYVLKVHDNCGNASNCKYALGTDIISYKYVVVNDKSNLEVVDKSCLDDCLIEEYEFIGDKKLLNKINKAYQEQKVVDNTFIYTALTGKPLLCSDQIDFDENFVKVDFDLFKENNNTIKATFQHEASIALNNESNTIKNEVFIIPEHSIMEDRLRKELNRYKSISLMQDENGYYLYGNITKKYSKKVESMNLITEAMINSVL